MVVAGTGTSFYDHLNPACHLDLIPYATSRKWTELGSRQRAALIDLAADTVGLLLRSSAIRVLILNGQSVVTQFEAATGIVLDSVEKPEWALRRQWSNHVRGIAYHGVVDTVNDYPLPHDLLVLGFNHNLQSSYGVTTAVVHSIRQWINDMSCSTLSATSNGSQ
jgi:hypothetical protein